MPRSSLLAGALVCLLVTAGCLGAFGGESTPPGTTPDAPIPGSETALPPSSGSPTSTPSAAGSPTATPTRVAMALPVDPKDTGVGSPGQFAEAHRATLRNTSFTARYSYVESVVGEAEIRTSGILHYDGTDTVYYNYTTRRPGRDTVRRVAVWSNGTAARRAVTTPDGTVVEDMEPVDDVRTFAGRVNVYLRAFGIHVTGYSRLGEESMVRIFGGQFDLADERDTVEGLAFRLGYDRLSDGSLSAVVTDDALRRYRVELNPTSEVTVVEELEIMRLGTTEVRRPGWARPANETRSR